VRVDAEMAAVPFDTAAVPIAVVPSMKVTVPVGVPVAGATGNTVAVNVIVCATAAGFCDDVRVTDATWLLRTV
jgi:hypothetical protein